MKYLNLPIVYQYLRTLNELRGGNFGLIIKKFISDWKIRDQEDSQRNYLTKKKNTYILQRYNDFFFLSLSLKRIISTLRGRFLNREGLIFVVELNGHKSQKWEEFKLQN